MVVIRFLFLLVTLCFSNTSLAQTTKDTLIVGYRVAPPFLIENDVGLEGVNAWLWDRVAKDLGIEYKLVPMKFSVMLDALKNGEIDVSINPLTITSARNKYMHFTDSFYASNSTIAVANSSPFQKFKMFIKKFFSVNFIKGFLVLLFIIMLFGFLGWFFERKRNPKHFRSGYRGIWDGIWWASVTLTTVGYGDKAPKSKGGRISALALMFGGLLFISGLTASIASNLTVSQISNNPNSFNEFKDRSVGCVTNSASNTFLKEHFFKDIKVFDNANLGLQALQKNKIDAFIYDEPILRYLLDQNKDYSNINIIPVRFDIQFYAFGFSKANKKLEEVISQEILEIVEGKEWELILNEFGLSEL